MSGHVISASFSSFGHNRIGSLFATLRSMWAEAQRTAASRRNLAYMDDRMLSDIGVSRSQAQFEASRWH